MRCVVDASIVIKWFVHEPDSEAALALRTRHRLVAPDLLTAEFANILATKFRVGDLDGPRCDIAAQSLAASGIDLRALSELLLPALRIARHLQHPAYDCFYLALAEAEGCPFVTADQRFLRAVATRGDPSHKAACVPLGEMSNR